VPGLRHELVGLDESEVGEPAEVRLEAPDPLLRVEHRVVVALRLLELHGEAVRDDLVAGTPGIDAGAGAQDDAGEVGTEHVVGPVVLARERRDGSVPPQEAEGVDRLEDRGPDRVVVDRAGHHGDQRLAGADIRCRDLLDVQARAGVLLRGRDPLEHRRLVRVDGEREVAVRNGQGGVVLRPRLAGGDGVDDLLHGASRERR
jgi:hypothetical protein